MDFLSKLDAFETWLRATGSPEDVALFSRSLVVGLLAVAGKAPMTAEHVAQAVQLARDAGISDVAPMERLGALLVQLDAVPPQEELPEAAPPPESLAISIRVPKVSTMSLPVVAAKPRRPFAALAFAVVAVAGAGAWWLTRGDSGPPDAAPVVVLEEVLPDGWRVVHAQRGATLVARGGDQMFVATLPASAAKDELAVARTAEQGATAKLVASAAHYYSEGCAAAGEHTAVCRGTATLPGGEVVTLQTYVRVGARRAVLALVKAASSDDTAAIIEGFAL